MRDIARDRRSLSKTNRSADGTFKESLERAAIAKLPEEHTFGVISYGKYKYKFSALVELQANQETGCGHRSLFFFLLPWTYEDWISVQPHRGRRSRGGK